MSKKFIALALVAALAMGIGTAAYADGADVKDGTEGSTTVSYAQAETYTVVIPASATYDKTEGTTLSFTAKDLVLPSTKEVEVSVSQVAVKMTDDTSKDTFDIPLALGNDDLTAAETVVAKFTVDDPTNAIKEPLTLKGGAKVKYAGTYSGTITFAIAVADKTA